MRHRHVCLAAGSIAMIIQWDIVSICFFLLYTGISLGPSWAMSASLSVRSPTPEAATACQDRCVPKIALWEGPLGSIHTKWYILTQSGGLSKKTPPRKFRNLGLFIGYILFRMSFVFSTFCGGRRRSFIVHTPFRDTFAKTVCIYTLIFPSKSNLFAEPGDLELLSPGRAVLKAGRVSGGRSSAGVPVPCDNSRGSGDSQSGEKMWWPADSALGDREGTIHSRFWTE